MAYPMSVTNFFYQFIIKTADSNPTPISPKELDGDVSPAWTLDSTSSMDCLDTILPYEEEILEAMKIIDRPWDDLHHRSYFLSNVHQVELIFSSRSLTGDVHIVLNPLALA